MQIKKVIIVTNVPNPYRIPLFNEVHRQLLVQGVDLKVFFGAKTYERRKYKLNLAECSFTYEFLDSGKYSFGDTEKTFFTYKGLISALRKEKPDSVVINGFSIGTIKLWWFSLFNKTNYTIWSGSIERKGRNDSYLRRLQRKIVSSGAASFIVYGTLAARYLNGLGIPERKIHIAINTVDTAYFSVETNSIRKVLGPSHKSKLLYIGYLSPRKNVMRILEIIQELSKSRHDFILDIVGDGEDKPLLEAFVQKNNLNELVRFHGFKQKSELPAYLAPSSCFLFQTDFDIWGLVLNEAMAAGLPCISSPNAGASHDLIQHGENGFIVDYSDKKKVIDRITWILDHPEEASAMGQRAKHTIEKNASLQVSAAGIVNAVLHQRV